MIYISCYSLAAGSNMNGQHKDAGKSLSHKQEVTITEEKYSLIFRVHEGGKGVE